MIQALLSGIASGVGLSLMVGPVFFSLLQVSIHRGFRHGLFMAAGVVLSDATFVILVYAGFSTIIDFPGYPFWSSLAGGLLLFLFGASYLLKKGSAPQQEDANPIREANSALLVRGYLLNALNPGTLAYWLAIASSVTSNEDWTVVNHVLYFVGILTTIFATDCLKVYLAKRLSLILTPTFLLRLGRVLGVALMVFGVKLLFDAWHLFSNP